MTKAAEAFRTISEVADALGTPAHVLRFWESRFPQIKPVKRAGGRRYYRPSDVALLAGIKVLLHDRGLTIRGVQKILREEGVKRVATEAGIDVLVAATPDTPTEQTRPAPAPRKPVVVRLVASPQPAPQPPAAAKPADPAPLLFDALPEAPHRAPPPRPHAAAPAAGPLWSERLRRAAAPAEPAALAALHARALALRNRLAALARA